MNLSQFILSDQVFLTKTKFEFFFDKEPLGAQWVKAGEFSFHNTCFSCASCKQIISGSFSERNGNFYCKECFVDKKFVPPRHPLPKKPGEPASPACTPSASPQTKAPPPAPPKQETLASAAICYRCGEMIGHNEQKLFTLNKYFHTKCFVCMSCGNQFSTDNSGKPKFYTHNSAPICQDCKTRFQTQSISANK